MDKFSWRNKRVSPWRSSPMQHPPKRLKQNHYRNPSLRENPPMDHSPKRLKRNHYRNTSQRENPPMDHSPKRLKRNHHRNTYLRENPPMRHPPKRLNQNHYRNTYRRENPPMQHPSKRLNQNHYRNTYLRENPPMRHPPKRLNQNHYRNISLREKPPMRQPSKRLNQNHYRNTSSRENPPMRHPPKRLNQNHSRNISLRENPPMQHPPKRLKRNHYRNTSLREDLMPFMGSSYVERFKMLMTEFAEASLEFEKTPSIAPELPEISNFVWNIIFRSPDADMPYVERCFTIIRPYFISKSPRNIALTEMWSAMFLRKLCERFAYKECLQDLLKDRQIPLEKKEKWLQRQYEVQGQRLKDTDARSIKFLKMLFDEKPLFFYQAIEAVLRQPKCEETPYDFIDDVFKSVKPVYYYIKTFPSFRKNTELLECFQSIKHLIEESHSVPESTKTLLAEHENERFHHKDL